MDHITTLAHKAVPVVRVRQQQGALAGTDQLVEEVPVALVYNGIAHTVLMSLPRDLEDLAVGFSLTEGIIDSFQDIRDISLQAGCAGIEALIEISPRCFQRLKSRRRSLAGTTGCGICGAEQLSHVSRALPPLKHHLALQAELIEAGFTALQQQQFLNHETGATHAAGWLSEQGALCVVREDVGRHIALDKLIGHLARHSLKGGAALVTSRASFEMVQKAVAAGIEGLFAISAVTGRAVELAAASNLTLAGFCRPGRLSLYTHPERVLVASASGCNPEVA